MFFQKNPGKLFTHSCCVVTKCHTYLSKAVGKSSKSTKSDVFLKEFFNKFECINKQQLLMHSHPLKKFLTETLHFSGCLLFLKKWNNEIVVINITPHKILANFQIKPIIMEGGGKPCLDQIFCFFVCFYLYLNFKKGILLLNTNNLYKPQTFFLIRAILQLICWRVFLGDPHIHLTSIISRLIQFPIFYIFLKGSFTFNMLLKMPLFWTFWTFNLPLILIFCIHRTCT